MASLVKVEFPRKSNSKRRRIFRQRVRGPVTSMIKAFYEQSKLTVAEAKVEEIARLVVEDFITLAREPEFLDMLNEAPNAEESQIDHIAMEVKMANEGIKPFAFLQR